MSEFTVRRIKWLCVWVLAAYIGYRLAFPDSEQLVSDDALLSLVFLTLILVLLHELQKVKSIRFGPLRIAGVIAFGLGVIFFVVILGVTVFGGG